MEGPVESEAYAVAVARSHFLEMHTLGRIELAEGVVTPSLDSPVLLDRQRMNVACRNPPEPLSGDREVPFPIGRPAVEDSKARTPADERAIAAEREAVNEPGPRCG